MISLPVGLEPPRVIDETTSPSPADGAVPGDAPAAPHDPDAHAPAAPGSCCDPEARPCDATGTTGAAAAPPTTQQGALPPDALQPDAAPSDATPLEALRPDALQPDAPPPRASADAEAARAEPRAAAASAAPPTPLGLPVGVTLGMPVRGTVTSLDAEDVIVVLEIGHRARMRRTELADQDGKIPHLEAGVAVEGVVSAGGEMMRLRRRSSPRLEALARLAEAFTARSPVEGRITSMIKGGYEVKLLGLRAFCPASQAAIARGESPESYVGRDLPFLVTKFDPSGRSLVVSRRKLVEREQRRSAAETRTRITKGARLGGRVISFQPYGAFVDLGGIHGLLHVSEISHARLRSPEEALRIGQEVEVVVLDHDPAFKKVSLSMKVLAEDPWKAFAATVERGKVLRGRVRHLTSSGARVEVAAGVEGLLTTDAPADEASTEVAGPREGDEIDVQVIDVDPARHRLALGPAPAGSEPGTIVPVPELAAGARVKGTVERIAPFGVFVRLPTGRTGLLHVSEAKVPQGVDIATHFRPGARITVEVVEVVEQGDRIRLSCWSALERQARAAAPRMSQAQELRAPGPPPPTAARDGRRERGRGDERPERRERGGERREPRRDRGGGPGDERRLDRPPRRPRDRDASGANPAAAPRSGFASLGDILREKMGLPDADED